MDLPPSSRRHRLIPPPPSSARDRDTLGHVAVLVSLAHPQEYARAMEPVFPEVNPFTMLVLALIGLALVGFLTIARVG